MRWVPRRRHCDGGTAEAAALARDIEPLMTAPVRDWQVVLAKFFGALFFYLVLWIPTLLYFGFFKRSLANRLGIPPAPTWARI